ncbi:MAG: hypothetical protein HKN82_00225 [Akkermansiaceae bacterium]|nr:hypothetical protein [Akkermansiaceae bacterium]
MKSIAYVLILLGSGLAGAPSTRAQGSGAEPTAGFTPEARSAYLTWQQSRRDADLAYVASLRAALEKATRRGQLDEAVAIRAEIKRIAQGLRQGDEPPVPLAEFLAGTSWVSNINGVVIELAANGKGKRLHRGTEKDITYKVSSDEEFTILWPVGPSAPCTMAADRKSFASGDATWKRKPGK